MKPFGEWDLLLAPSMHRWLLLASVVPAFALTTLFFNNKRLRPFVGGLALGSAALLGQIGLTGESFFALGSVGLRLFCAANIAACLWVARMNLDERRS